MCSSADACSTPSARGQFALFRPPAFLRDLDGDLAAEDDSFEYFRPRDNPLDSSESEESLSETVHEVPNNACDDPVNSYVYIDDFNCIEKLALNNTESHISMKKTRLKVLANKSESLFNNVKDLAADINMKVNNKKTQLLCIHASKNYEVSSYIRQEPEEMVSSESLKILGFTFHNRPDAVAHVTAVIDNMYGKLWTLRFLKRSGMGTTDLEKVYDTVIRAAAEYASVVYHPLIPKYIAEKLEMVHKQAYKIMYGWNIQYDQMVKDGRVESLESRRVENSLKFATKNSNSERFGKRWFPINEDIGTELRPGVRNKYVEKFCRTERSRNNPIQYMLRQLNEVERS